jgi:hypothetical protein
VTIPARANSYWVTLSPGLPARIVRVAGQAATSRSGETLPLSSGFTARGVTAA